jgi:hypothetical protein
MKHFDPREAPLPAELIPLCNLYDRHILRQKVVIELSLSTEERIKMRSSGGDTATGWVDQIHLWHLKHTSEVGEMKTTSFLFPTTRVRKVCLAQKKMSILHRR